MFNVACMDEKRVIEYLGWESKASPYSSAVLGNGLPLMISCALSMQQLGPWPIFFPCSLKRNAGLGRPVNMPSLSDFREVRFFYSIHMMRTA